MAERYTCDARVWDVGDMTNCGKPAILKDGQYWLCKDHVLERLQERQELLKKMERIRKEAGEG